jgi:hypothetical protein
MLQKNTSRDQLRATIAEREKRRQCVEEAAAALDRGSALLRDAEARLQTEFADVDAAIATHHAERVKAWASFGGEKPSIEVPKTLLARRKARDETIEQINAARIASETLSRELDAAKNAFIQSERTASEATVPIMLEEAEQVATYLIAARREVWRLEAQLRALGETWVSGKEGPRPVRLSRKVLDALSAQEPQYPGFQRPEIKQAASWRAFYTALLTDPDATWEEEGL